MIINKPSNDMRMDLSKAAKKLRRTSVGLLGMAVRLSEAGLEDESLKLLTMARDLNEIEDAAVAYAKEVRTGVVARSSIN
ncbi:hypothetical protein [Pseudomonas sp. DSP3-2-2]|uniref:hypothetical protein n=1 Tax=unclassified Pseudomonas TaxID=196821 RepID=UPI003CEDF92F